MLKKMDASEFFESFSSLTNIGETDLQVLIDPRQSSKDKLHVSLYPCDCSSQWFDIPGNLVDITPLGVHTCCDEIHVHALLNPKEGFDSLLSSLSRLAKANRAQSLRRDLDLPSLKSSINTSHILVANTSTTPHSALRKEIAVNAAWQWGANQGTCFGGLSKLKYNEIDALEYFSQGQSHNYHVTRLYEEGWRTLSDFWEIVVGASYTPTSSNNLAEARVNIKWQYGANLESLTSAWREWPSASGSGKAFSISRAYAMYHLLWGQRHNESVMSLYRACFRDDPNGLFAIIRDFVG